MSGIAPDFEVISIQVADSEGDRVNAVNGYN